MGRRRDSGAQAFNPVIFSNFQWFQTIIRSSDWLLLDLCFNFRYVLYSGSSQFQWIVSEIRNEIKSCNLGLKVGIGAGTVAPSLLILCFSGFFTSIQNFISLSFSFKLVYVMDYLDFNELILELEIKSKFTIQDWYKG